MDGGKMKTKLGGIILSFFIFIGISKAAIPPEIPEQRIIQIFSSFYFDMHDMGEKVLIKGDGSN